MSPLLQAKFHCRSRGESGAAEKRHRRWGYRNLAAMQLPSRAARCGGRYRIDDTAGEESSSRSSTEGEPVRQVTSRMVGLVGFRTLTFSVRVGAKVEALVLLGALANVSHQLTRPMRRSLPALEGGAAGGGLTVPGTRDKVSLGGARRVDLRGHPHEGHVGIGSMTRQHGGGDVSGGVAGGTPHEPVDRGKCSLRQSWSSLIMAILVIVWTVCTLRHLSTDHTRGITRITLFLRPLKGREHTIVTGSQRGLGNCSIVLP